MLIKTPGNVSCSISGYLDDANQTPENIQKPGVKDMPAVTWTSET